MPGWETLLSPVLYHQPVAPEVPKADNTSANIISSNTSTAVGAFLRAAQQRQEADLETQKMAQDAALRLQGFDVEKRGQDLTYQASVNRLEAEKEGQGPLDELRKAETDHYKALTTAAGNAGKFDQSVAQMSQDFDKRFDELGLNNAQVQSNPGLLASGILTLKQEYPNAIPATGIPGRIATLEQLNKDQAISLTFDGKSANYYPTDVLMGLKNPETHDQFISALEKRFPGQQVEADTGKPATTWDKITNLWGGGHGLQNVPSQSLKSLRDATEAYHPELLAPRIPTGAPKTKGAFNAGAMSGTFDPTLPTVDMGVQKPPTKAGQLNAGASMPPPAADNGVQEEADWVKAQMVKYPDRAKEFHDRFVSKYPDNAGLVE